MIKKGEDKHKGEEHKDMRKISQEDRDQSTQPVSLGVGWVYIMHGAGSVDRKGSKWE